MLGADDLGFKPEVTYRRWTNYSNPCRIHPPTPHSSMLALHYITLHYIHITTWNPCDCFPPPWTLFDIKTRCALCSDAMRSAPKHASLKHSHVAPGVVEAVSASTGASKDPKLQQNSLMGGLAKTCGSVWPPGVPFRGTPREGGGRRRSGLYTLN